MNFEFYNISILFSSILKVFYFNISGFFVSISVHKSGCTHSHILCYI